jgi:GNAT superfamily N-acetyltransferase
MFRIVSSNAAPEHLERLRELVVAEWDDVDSFEDPGAALAVPPPLLAITGPELVGGLAFTCFPEPANGKDALWINAVIVAPGHRRNGIASRLVRTAEIEAVRAGHSELFVRTDIPELYTKLDWRLVSSTGEGQILMAAIADR